MGENSNIAWTDDTFNPWRGCEKYSPGCKNCYAETFVAKRQGLAVWGPANPRKIAAESTWKMPLKWQREAEATGKRRKVFCMSLGDLFEDRADLEEPRARLARLIEATPALTWLLLTKRSEHMVEMGKRMGWEEEWPDNTWAGATVENQETAEDRIPHLLRVPARVHFLSCEPLLEEINIVHLLGRGVVCECVGKVRCNGTMIRCNLGLRRVSQVICGGESGPKARPFDLAWARSLRDQCKLIHTAFFMKQVGSNPVMSPGPITWPTSHPKGEDPSEWPEDLRIQQSPLQGDDHASSPGRRELACNAVEQAPCGLQGRPAHRRAEEGAGHPAGHREQGVAEVRRGLHVGEPVSEGGQDSARWHGEARGAGAHRGALLDRGDLMAKGSGQLQLFRTMAIGGRKDKDHYPTPRSAIHPLWSYLSTRTTPGTLLPMDTPNVVLDPACGEGNILDYFLELGCSTVGLELSDKRALEARSRGHLVRGVDALKTSWPKAGLLVANPPYGKLAAKFVHKAMAWRRDNPHAYVAVLLYLSFLEPAGDRRALFASEPPDVLILPTRPRFKGEKKSTNAQASAWYLWPGTGQVTWLKTTLQGTP